MRFDGQRYGVDVAQKIGDFASWLAIILKSLIVTIADGEFFRKLPLRVKRMAVTVLVGNLRRIGKFAVRRQKRAELMRVVIAVRNDGKPFYRFRRGEK